MATNILDIVNAENKGYYIGNRLILPFKCQVIKLIIENEIFTEFVGNDHIKISQEPQNTSIYFRHMGKLRNFVGSYKVIKMIVAEWDADLCDPKTHIKFVCEIEEDEHAVDLHVPSDDMIFIE